MYEYEAIVRSVYDGDTVRLDIDLGKSIWLHNEPCRLLGIDTPELRGEEREKGIIARDALRELILGQTVRIKTKKDKSGKYGRLLVDIYLKDGKHINQWLLDMGFAVEISY